MSVLWPRMEVTGCSEWRKGKMDMSNIRSMDLFGIQEEARRLKLENAALRDTISCMQEVLEEFKQDRNPFRENRMALYLGQLTGIASMAETNVAWALEHGYAVDHRVKKSPGS